MSAPIQWAGVFPGIPLKASSFFIGFGFAGIPFENAGSNKTSVGIYEGIIECQFLFVSALTLMVSPLQKPAPIK